MMRQISLSLSLVVIASTAAAQAVATRTLTTADAEWSEPFSQVNGLRELKDGRVIVSDTRDKTIQLLDWKTQAAKRIGREGSGPAEYGMPTAVFAAPGDTTWVFDMLNSRYLVIDPTGKAVNTFMVGNENSATAPQQVRAGGRLRTGIGFGFAQGIDAQGRLYFRAPSVRFSGDGASIGDSTPIIRYDRRTKKSDTVGILVNPPAPAMPAPQPAPDGGQRVTVRLGGATPFASADAYAVTARGDVVVVRAKDYHVDWISGGTTIAGAPIRYDRLKVTDEDKKAYMESQKNSTATMVSNINGQRSAQTMSAADLNGANAPDFPEFKGPFINAVAGPNNQIWVQRYMPAGAPPTYDVIDATGKVIQRVVLPKSTRLLGFGAGTVYLVRNDEDDLQYVQRYRWQ